MQKILRVFKPAFAQKWLIILNLSDPIAACRRTVRKGSAFPGAIVHFFS
jgi:hypothetical protein